MCIVNYQAVSSTVSHWQPCRELVLASLVTTLVLASLAIYTLTSFSWHPVNTIVFGSILAASLVTIFLMLKRECTPVPAPLPKRGEDKKEPSLFPSGEQKETVRRAWMEKEFPDVLSKPSPSAVPQKKKERTPLVPLPAASKRAETDKKESPKTATPPEDPKEALRRVWTEKNFPTPPPKPSPAVTQKVTERKKPTVPKVVNATLQPTNQKKEKPVERGIEQKPTAPSKPIEEALYEACEAYKTGEPVIFGRVLRLVDRAIESNNFAAFLFQSEKGTSLEILIEKLQASAQEKCETQEVFMQRLELEVLFRIVEHKIRSCSSVHELYPLIRSYLDKMCERANPYLSEKSLFVPQETYFDLSFGLSLFDKERATDLLLQSQGIKTEREEGTRYDEGMRLNLFFLIEFLTCGMTCRQIHNCTYPIAENCRFYIMEIAPDINGELPSMVKRVGALSEIAKNFAKEIAENIVNRADECAEDPLKEVFDQIFNLGWTGHQLGGGLRRRGEEDYVLSIVNGGEGIEFQPAYKGIRNPLYVLSGTRAQAVQTLTELFLLQAAAYDRSTTITPENFYKVIKENPLIEEEQANLPIMRMQPQGNCGIHNSQELIYFNIQRAEAFFAEQNSLQNSAHFPSSVANKLQLFIYRAGALMIRSNPFVPEIAQLKHKKKPLLPGISYT